LFAIVIGHRCDKPGCGSTIVLDGNMKNHRDVCMANEAGYAEFKGLPGRVKTGCPNTPKLKSRYCDLHTPTLFESTDDGTNKEVQLAFIIAKKVTRNTTLYQVQCIHIYIAGYTCSE
jgi:hypothetical protein